MSLNLNFYFLFLVRELGKFHGECYALKESNRGLFHIITKSFRESRFNHNKVDMVWDATMRTSPKRGTQAIREHPELRRIIPESFLKKIDDKAEHAWDILRGFVEPREPLATICHGDYLRNNIAFQYDENVRWNNKLIGAWKIPEKALFSNSLVTHSQFPHAPVKAMMFDFQTLRYSSPMVDLACFLANSTGTDVRSTHFSFIFKTYHEEVIKSMMFALKKSRQDIPEHYRLVDIKFMYYAIFP